MANGSKKGIRMLSNIDRWAVVAEIVRGMRAKGGWAGETHLQKTLYFIQEMLQVPCGYDYVLYKHGPYSFDLHDDLARMLTNSILGIEPRPPYGPSLRVEDVGVSVIKRRSLTVNQYEKQIMFATETLGTKDVRELERLGTALLLKRRDPSLGEASLANEIVQHKPHVPENLALDAVKEVTNIELAAKAAAVLV